MNKLNSKTTELFREQVSNWELARVNYKGLQTVKTRTISFGDFDVLIQFNPARIVSTGAKMDAKDIAERPCFLCLENLPIEQKAVDAGDYVVLVNPFPIFPQHFTIPRKKHEDQQIKPYFQDMLELARTLDKYLLFYNGPECGASAPDHMHFQAGTKDFLPLVNDYKRLKETHVQLIIKEADYELYQMKNYLRLVYCIESTSISAAQDMFNLLYSRFQKEKNNEPMMNIICNFENGKWYTFVLPRATFRPWQYTAKDDNQLLISPATVEMSGIFITPIESHFERITKKDIEDILKQVSF